MGSKWGKLFGLNPPDSPPSDPVIPEGLATKLGKYGTLVMLLFGTFLEVSHVSLDKDATLALAGALLTLLTTIAGRMHQAAKIYEAAPSPLQGATGVVNFANNLLGDEGATYVPGEDEVEADFPDGMPPADEPTVPPGLGQ